MGKYKPNTEDAIAYGWLALSLFLIIAAFMYVYLMGFVNMMINGPNGDQSIGINHDIKEGTLSQQGVNAISFNAAMLTNIPLWLIIGALIFSVARAITVKG